MSGARNIPVPRRGAMPAIGIDQIKPGNSLMVSPGNYGTFSTLQEAYNWLASSDRDAEMGALSATNRRAIILSPGLYTLSTTLTLDTSFVDMVGMTTNRDDTLVYLATGDVIKQTCENIKLGNFHSRSGETNTANESHNLYIYNERRGSAATTTSAAGVYKIIKTGIGVNVTGTRQNSINPDEVFIWGGSATHGWYEVKFVTTTTTTDDTIVLMTDPGASAGDVNYAICFQQSEYRNLRFSDAYTELSDYSASSQDDICGPLFIGHVGGIWDNCKAGDNSFRVSYLDYPTKADVNIALTDDTALADNGADAYGLPGVRIPIVKANHTLAVGDWVAFSGVTGYSRSKYKVTSIQDTYFVIRCNYAAFTTTETSLIKKIWNLEFRPRQFTHIECGDFAIAGDLARKLHAHLCENVVANDSSFAGCASFGSEVTGIYRNIVCGQKCFALSVEFGGHAENVICNGPYCFAGWNTGVTVSRGSLIDASLKNIIINDTTAGKSFAGCTDTTNYGGIYNSILENIRLGTVTSSLAGTSYAGATQNISNSVFRNCHPSLPTPCTANTTIYEFNSGQTYNNTGATGSITFTLPTPMIGLKYKFFVTAAQAVVIEPGDAAIQKGLNTATGTAGDYITSSTAGDWIEIECFDGATWTCIGASQAWTEEA